MSDPVLLEITAGLPYRRRIRVTNGTSLWANLVDFEVRSQLREGKTISSTLLLDLAQFITKSLDGADIVLVLAMTGAETRTLSDGYFDIILSDPGIEDENAIPALTGKVKIGTLITAASDD